MELLYILLVLLISTRIMGELANRIKLPSLLGEILAGIILGIVFNSYSVHFPVLSSLEENEVFHAIKELSIFFLMLHAGLELKPGELKKTSGKAAWIALGGMAFPFLLGLLLGWYVFPEGEHKFTLLLFLGVVLSITAVPVAVKLLMDLKKLDTKLGKSIVSAAVIDDVISLLLLAVLTSLVSENAVIGWSGIALLVSKILGFFLITFLIGKYLIPKTIKFVSQKTLNEEMEISLLLIVAFSFSLLAEFMGLHFIMGAFVAGLFFVPGDMDKRAFHSLEKKVRGISSGFLAPIFFASIGLNIDTSALFNVPVFIAVLIGIAVLGKVVGSGIPAYSNGFSLKESLSIGFSMNARGVVSIIIADIVLKTGLFDKAGHYPIVDNLFSAVVIMAVLTTIISPIALRVLLGKTTDK